jgi:hypothetical protein
MRIMHGMQKVHEDNARNEEARIAEARIAAIS